MSVPCRYSSTQAGWMGKGKEPGQDSAEEQHVARPISTLKDPTLFGPPPKNVNYHGGAALPDRITPDRSGLGKPLSREEIQARRAIEDEELRLQEEADKPPPPPVPYRMDTTGLSTTHLPPPPVRRDGADGRTPATLPPSKPKPGLPPRLPPRQNSNPGPGAASPPPPYKAAAAEPPAHRGYLNQGPLNRLGAAGVSVPGFGIGAKPTLPPPVSRTSSTSTLRMSAASPPPPPRSQAASPAPASVGSAQLGELQSRFSRLGTSSSTPEAPASGTTWAQKQAALKTAQSFHKDPSSISLSDARSAASTANNFRERHGDQVASGYQSANKLNNKYGIADKVGGYAGMTPAANTPEPIESPTIQMHDNTVVKKKAPPPPPKKKPALAGGADAGEGPPPLPLASKPKPPVS